MDVRREAARTYRQLGPVAYRCTLALLGREEEAARATREVFAKLVRDLAALSGAGGAVALVRGAAARHCERLLRRRGERPPGPPGSEGCLSPLDLEEAISGGSRGRAHLADCAPCRDRLASMERQGEAFRRDVYAGTVDAVMDAAADPWRGPRRWLLAFFPAGGLVASAGLFFLLAPRPASDEMGPRRAPLTLAVYAGDAARPLRDGDRLSARTPLRFRVRTSRPCRLTLLAKDGGGVATVFPDPRAIEGTSFLPGAATLRGEGPVRLYAVCAEAPLAAADLERAVGAATSGGEEALRLGGTLAGLPASASQASVLLERDP